MGNEGVIHNQPDPEELMRGPQNYDNEEDDRDNLNNICNFLSNYVSKLYGVHAIRTWLKNNKGKSFLQMISMCDVAYCICLVRNSDHVWKQDKLVREMDKLEQEKYKSWKSIIDPEERGRYQLFTPRFSGGRGMKRTFCGVMWNEEGLKYYEEALVNWRAVYNDQILWQKLEVAWEQYVVANNSCETVCAHWKRKEDVALMDDDSMSLNSQELMAGGHELVAFPGDLDFVGDGTQDWVNSNDVGGENDIILHNGGGDTEDGTNTLGKELDEAMMNDENETVEDDNDGKSNSDEGDSAGSDSGDSREEQARGAARGMFNDKNYDKSRFANKKGSLLGIGGYSDESGSSESEESDLDHSDGECKERRKERRYYIKNQKNGGGEDGERVKRGKQHNETGGGDKKSKRSRSKRKPTKQRSNNTKKKTRRSSRNKKRGEQQESREVSV